MATDELITRIRAALDTAEQQARAAWPSPWEIGERTTMLGGSACVMMPLPFPDGTAARTGLTSYVPLGRQDEGTIRHIAAWDPSRVLRLIERDRALLMEFKALEELIEEEARERGGAVLSLLGQVGDVRDGWLRAGRLLALQHGVERAAEFWLGEDTNDG